MKDNKDLLDCLMIYTLISGEGNSSCGSSRNPGRVSLLKVIVFIMAACGIIALICILTAPTCATSGCGNVPAGDSRYCTYHKKMYSSGTTRNTAASKTTTAPKVTTSPKQTTNKKTTTKKKVTTYKDDPYDIYEYDDPEDFYYNNYDDFEGYEDAEDYFYDNRY